MIAEDYVSLELAKKLKGKGYPQTYNDDDNYIEPGCYYFNGSHHYDRDDKECSSQCTDELLTPNDWTNSYNYENHEYYGVAINCPTLYQAQKWLREEKNIEIFIVPHKRDDRLLYEWFIADVDSSLNWDDNYEKALETAIEKSLELC